MTTLVSVAACFLVAGCAGQPAHPDARAELPEAGGDANLSDAGEPAATGDAAPPLPDIEVDCRPRYDEPGRFQPHCQLLATTEVRVECGHVSEAGSGGMLVITVRHPERVRLGDPVPIGGTDSTVELSGASTSLRENAIVAVIDGTASGAIVFHELRPGQAVRGRLLGVAFQSLPDPPFACRIADAEFEASGAGPAGER
jgi:hypothetical protein